MRANCFFSIIITLALAGSASTQAFAQGVARDVNAFRKSHPTQLTTHGPTPAIWQDPTPLHRPDGVDEVTYPSGDLALKAWVSHIANDGTKRPAVVFCHGGFWFGDSDWTAIKPLLDAGFVVMTPRVRGENGGPGEFSYYYGEVDDAVAAGRWLAKQPGIDASRLFISGHSAGAVLATFAVMVADTPYKLAVPISPSLDQRSAAKFTDARDRSLLVFDANSLTELQARSPVLFTASLRTPITLLRGSDEKNEEVFAQFATLAQHFGKTVTTQTVPGNHFEALTSGMPEVAKRLTAYAPPGSTR